MRFKDCILQRSGNTRFEVRFVLGSRVMLIAAFGAASASPTFDHRFCCYFHPQHLQSANCTSGI